MVVYDTVTPIVVLQMDFGNVVGSPTGGYTEVEVTIVGRVLRFYAPTSGGGGTTVHNDLSGLNAGDYQHLTVAEKANIALKDAGAFTTVAPTSAVAASGSTDLMRKGETDTGLAAKQTLDATLTALAGLATGADKVPYSTGTDTFAQSDLTSFARTLLDDTDAATARATLSAQALDATLTALAGLATGADKLAYSTGTDTFSQTDLTSFARTLLDDANATAARATLSASELSHGHDGVEIVLDDSGWSAALQHSGVRECQALADFIDTGMQPLSAALTAIAALTTSADKLTYATGSNTFSTVTLTSFVRTILDDTDAATVRTTIGAQPLDATLTALAGLATGADKLAYSTGTDTFAQADLTSFGRSLIDDADAAAARTTLDVRSPHVYTIWTGPTVGYVVPSTEGLFLGSAPWSCQPYDGTRATQARITGCHVGAASSGTVYLRAKYTTNGQAAGTYNTVGTWTQLGASAQVVATMGTGAGANYFDSGWIDIASGAKIDGMIAVTGLGGNDSTSITFYKLNIEFR